MLSALLIVVPVPTMAQVDIGVHISLPPLIVFEAPPEVIVIPDVIHEKVKQKGPTLHIYVSPVGRY